MAVLYIITKLQLGGAQKVCLTLTEGLGSTVPTWCIAGQGGTLDSSVTSKKNVILLPALTREVSLRGLVSELQAFVQLITKIRALRKTFPQLIVHTHSTKAGLLGRWAAFFAGVKHRVHTIHGFAFHDHQPWFVRNSIRLLELITSLITTHFVCVSTADMRTGRKTFPYFAQKYSLIRAAVDETAILDAAKMAEKTGAQKEKITKAITGSSIDSEQKPFVFGTIACFKPQKNLFDLLEAFRSIVQAYPHARLELIGDGILRTDIEAWIAKHQLQNHITLHGWQHDVAPFLLRWQSFVLSSLWEGLPCSIIEARLAQLPVISYNTGGIADVIIHGKNGFLIKQKDRDGLAQAFATLIAQPDLYRRLRSYPDNLAPFFQTTMLQEHIKLYQSLVNR